GAAEEGGCAVISAPSLGRIGIRRNRRARGEAPDRAGKGEAGPRLRPGATVAPGDMSARDPERPAPARAGEKRPPRGGRALAGPLRPGRFMGNRRAVAKARAFARETAERRGEPRRRFPTPDR